MCCLQAALPEGLGLGGGGSSQLLRSCSSLAKGSSGEGAAPQAHDSALLWMKSLSSESKLFVSNNIYGELQTQVQGKAPAILPTHSAFVWFKMLRRSSEFK